MWRTLLRTSAPPATVLIRILVGAVFVSEGIQKFLFPDAVGAGRFASIGFSQPEFWATFVGIAEIVAGTLVLLGFLTRLGALVLTIDMIVAMITTKLPILVGHDIGPFRVRQLSSYGFWSMAHESRTDFAMLLGSLFLLIVGAGLWSIDARIKR
jgi:uncharacterized membrane protein YphA (DoxX/SURF4 family)